MRHLKTSLYEVKIIVLCLTPLKKRIMKITDSLMAEATEMLSNNIEAIASAKRIVSIGCSGCGMGCSGIVGG